MFAVDVPNPPNRLLLVLVLAAGCPVLAPNPPNGAAVLVDVVEFPNENGAGAALPVVLIVDVAAGFPKLNVGAVLVVAAGVDVEGAPKLKGLAAVARHKHFH